MHKADNLIAICEPSVSKVWDPGRLTTLWASTACYKDSVTIYFYFYHTVHYSFRFLSPSLPLINFISYFS
jgi:hypothetical protein